MLPPEQGHYVALLRDESLPLMLRLAMGVSLTRMITSPPVTHAAGQLLHAALSARLPVPQEQEAGIFCTG